MYEVAAWAVVFAVMLVAVLRDATRLYACAAALVISFVMLVLIIAHVVPR